MPGRHASTSTDIEHLLRQRAALADFGAEALASTDPDRLLAAGARLCAAGLGVPFCAVLEHRAEGDLLVRAGVGCNPCVVGRAAVRGDDGGPGGGSFLTGRPMVVHHLRGAEAADTPDMHPRHGIASTPPARCDRRARPRR